MVKRSFTELAEFYNQDPTLKISLTDYYRGGGIVPNTADYSAIPTTGKITLNDLFVIDPTFSWASQQRNLRYLSDGNTITITLPAAVRNPAGVAIVYSVTGLASALSFDPATRVLSIPKTTANIGIYQLTYTASSQNVDNLTQKFSVTIRRPVLTWDSTQTDFTHSLGQAFTATLPFADRSAGNNPITYAVTGLPNGLTFSPSTREITGTVTDSNEISTHTISYTAESRYAKTIAQTFDITIRRPVLTWDSTQVDRSFATGSASFISPLPSATSDVGGTITYSASGLPPGWTFLRATRAIGGVVTNANAGTYTISYRARRQYATTITQTFDIIFTAVVLSWQSTQTDFTHPLGQAFAATLPTARRSAGNNAITYAVTGLPDGLTFSPSTRRITGTVTDSDEVSTHTISYTASSSNVPDITQTFDITITEIVLSWQSTQTDFTHSLDQAFAATLPVARRSMGNNTITYAVTGLPDGLTFSPSTRKITGTVTDSDEASTHTISYTASSSNVTDITQTFDITIVNMTWDKQQGDIRITTGRNFSRALPEATRSDSVTSITYTVTGLPTGLTFNANTRVVSGSVARSGVGAYAISYEATSTNAPTITQLFDITVFNPATLSWDSQQADVSYTVNQAITLALPAATLTGGASVTYTLTGLPTGLSFAAGTRTISGTVTAANQIGTHTLTYGASGGGLSISQSIDLVITAETVEPITYNAPLFDSHDNPRIGGGLRIGVKTPAISGYHPLHIYNYADFNRTDDPLLAFSDIFSPTNIRGGVAPYTTTVNYHLVTLPGQLGIDAGPVSLLAAVFDDEGNLLSGIFYTGDLFYRASLDEDPGNPGSDSINLLNSILGKSNAELFVTVAILDAAKTTATLTIKTYIYQEKSNNNYRLGFTYDVS